MPLAMSSHCPAGSRCMRLPRPPAGRRNAGSRVRTKSPRESRSESRQRRKRLGRGIPRQDRRGLQARDLLSDSSVSCRGGKSTIIFRHPPPPAPPSLPPSLPPLSGSASSLRRPASPPTGMKLRDRSHDGPPDSSTSGTLRPGRRLSRKVMVRTVTHARAHSLPDARPPPPARDIWRRGP